MTKVFNKKEVRRNISRAIYENTDGQNSVSVKGFADKIGIDTTRFRDILDMQCAVNEQELHAIAGVIGISADKIIRGEI